MGEIDAAQETVVTALERSAAEYGLPRSCGRLYGVLYFADEPQSLDDLSAESGYAKSTVSDAVGTLEDLYLARPVSPPDGGRRSYYEAERDLWYAFERIAQDSGRREIELMSRALDDAETTLEDVDDADAELERVRNLQRIYEQSEVLLDALQELSPEELLDALGGGTAGDGGPSDGPGGDPPGHGGGNPPGQR